MTENVAAALCALLLNNRGPNGRFAMELEALQGATGLSWHEIHEAVGAAIDCAWLRRNANGVELRAAGIHVAKKQLNLL